MRYLLWLPDLHRPHGVLTAAALALILSTAALFWVGRRSRQAIPIPEYAIVHTLWGRLKTVAWTVVAAVVALLVTHWLKVNHYPDQIIDLLGALLVEVRAPASRLMGISGVRLAADRGSTDAACRKHLTRNDRLAELWLPAAGGCHRSGDIGCVLT